MKGSAFVEDVLAFDFVPVLSDHEIDAVPGGSFFASFGEQDHIAIEGNFPAVQFEKDFEIGRARRVRPAM